MGSSPHDLTVLQVTETLNLKFKYASVRTVLKIKSYLESESWGMEGGG